MAIVTLAASNTSIIPVGKGTKMNRMLAIKPSGRIHSCHCESRVMLLNCTIRKVVLDRPEEATSREAESTESGGDRLGQLR